MNAGQRPIAHEEHGLLLGQLALVLAPQARTLPVSVSAMLVVLLAWRWLLWRRRAPLPSRLVLGAGALLVLLLAAALTWQSGGFGRDMAVALLGAFVILKLLECRRLSDATLVTQLSFYLLLTLYLSDQPFWLALYSLAIGAWVLRNWLLLHHPEVRGRLAIWPLLGRMALIGLPWAILLFVLFPRLEHPLWRLPQGDTIGRTGLGETLRPGSIGELVRSPEVTMRADIEGPLLPSSALYWRAFVLWQYDGTEWHPGNGRALLVREAPPAGVVPAATGTVVRYSVTLEPSQQAWLPMLDRGVSASGPGRTMMSRDGEFFADDPLTRRARYTGVAVLSGNGHGWREGLDASQRARALALPPGNPRSRELAAAWTRQYPDPAARVQAALRRFAAAPFAYTLKPPPLGREQVDSFVFDTRRGFCEHYATSFVFLMRAAGVPARVVVGYQGGEYNPVGRHYIVRQGDAHAWAEVWLDGRGWVRVDPTAAIAPERIEAGADALLAESDAAASRAGEARWLRQLRWGVDGLVYTWQRWVMQYDRSRQSQLLEQLGITASVPQALLAGIALLSLAGVLRLVLPAGWWGRRERDPLRALHERFCQLLARHGCVRGPAEGPRDFSARAVAALPQAAAAAAVLAFTDAYVRARYAGPVAHGSQAQLDALRRALRDLKKALRG